MAQVQVTINDEVSELLGDTPDAIAKHALEMIVLELYRRRELSAGVAGRLLGLDRFAFVRWAGERGVPYLDMTPEEWQQELRVIRKR
jgi:hypothetical protein